MTETQAGARRWISCPPWGPSVVLLLLVHLGLVSSQWRQFPNVGEVQQLVAGVSYWVLGDFSLMGTNPPLVRMWATLPVAGMPWSNASSDYDWRLHNRGGGAGIIMRLLQDEGSGVARRFLWPRIFCFVFSAILLVVLAYWLDPLLGRWGALVATAFASFCPNMIAFGGMICSDLAAVSLGLVACWAAWHYVQHPGYQAASLAGLGLGLALLTKFTWVTAIVSLPVTVALCLWFLRGHFPSRSWLERGADLVLFWGVSLLVVNAGYLFEDSFRPLGEYRFLSEMLGGEGANPMRPANRFEGTWLAAVPVPVPRNYLLGIDVERQRVEQKMWSFLMGEWKLGGWPHFYLMTTLFKTPEPTLLAAALGLGVLIVGAWRGMVDAQRISMFLFLGIPAGVCFASISLQGGHNHHHRYVMMIYPFLFALGGCLASPLGRRLLRIRLPFWGSGHRSVGLGLAVCLALLSGASTLRVHPHYLSYFNTLSGGPSKGWHLLGFSNIEWGQDILEVERWMQEHPECRPLGMDLGYLGGLDGELFGVSTREIPRLPSDASIDQVRRMVGESQWWIISVNNLYNRPGAAGREYLQQIDPVDRIAYSYHVYRIDPLEGDGSPEGQSDDR